MASTAFSLKVELEMDDHPEAGEEEDIKYGPPTSRNFELSLKGLPRVKDEKPLIGPTSSTGNIQVLYPQQIDGYKPDHNELSMMEHMGLPTGFSFGHMEQVDPRQTRGHKKTFYCQTCLIELNSEDTMLSHMKGVKHMKKQLALTEKLRNQGQTVMPLEIVPIKNPEPTRRKVPIRLQDKIKETSNPVVGLDYVREFIAVSDSEMEPHYECSICDNQGQANGMFSHLMGQKHRQAFVNRVYGIGIETVRMSQAQLLEKAHEHNENVSGFTDRIKTRYSDEEYPWPSGKEPWSLLRGGTGIVPDSARKNYGNKQSKAEVNVDGSTSSAKIEGERKSSVVDSSRPRSSPSFILPSAGIKPPTSSLDCKKMLELGKRMLLKAVDYQGTGLGHNERALLETCLATVAMKMSKGRNLPINLSSGVSSSSLPTNCLPSSAQRRSDFSGGGRTPPSNSSASNSGSGSRGTRSPSSAENGMNGSRYGARSSPTTRSKRSRSPSSAGSSWSGSSCRGRSPSARRRRTRSPSTADGYLRDARIKRERSVAESKSRAGTFSSSKRSPSYRNGGNETLDSGIEDGYHMGGERQRGYDGEERRARGPGFWEGGGYASQDHRNQDSCYQSDDRNRRQRDYEKSKRGRRDNWSGSERYSRHGGGRGEYREGW